MGFCYVLVFFEGIIRGQSLQKEVRVQDTDFSQVCCVFALLRLGAGIAAIVSARRSGLLSRGARQDLPECLQTESLNPRLP